MSTAIVLRERLGRVHAGLALPRPPSPPRRAGWRSVGTLTAAYFVGRAWGRRKRGCRPLFACSSFPPGRKGGEPPDAYNRSTIMTSNRPIEEWGKLVGDVPTATAILDRFLQHAEIIHITGKSYRLKDRSGSKTPVDKKDN